MIFQHQWKPCAFIVVHTETTPLIITHCCSNDSISNIIFITLINAIDLTYFYEWALSPSI